MRFISSKDNKIVKEAAALSEKKYRDRKGLYLLEGPDPILEAFMHGGRPRFIFISAGAETAKKIKKITDLAEKSAAAVYELSEEAFARVSQTETPQGALAVMEKPKRDIHKILAESPGANILVLDRIRDAGNMGTLIRTAEAMGFGAVLLIKGSADPFSPKAVRSAAGSILRMPLIFSESGEEALAFLRDAGKTPYAAVMRRGKSCCESLLAENAAVIIGCESSGVSDVLLKACENINIPMAGETESLNAALAGAIIMYEALRQKLCLMPK